MGEEKGPGFLWFLFAPRLLFFLLGTPAPLSPFGGGGRDFFSVIREVGPNPNSTNNLGMRILSSPSISREPVLEAFSSFFLSSPLCVAFFRGRKGGHIVQINGRYPFNGWPPGWIFLPFPFEFVPVNHRREKVVLTCVRLAQLRYAILCY